jgi:cytochrome c oxidase subunit 1
VNFIATTLSLRARGMTLLCLPLTCWAWFLTAVMILLSFTVLLAACVLLMMDRVAGTSFFVPAGLVISGELIHRSGGAPLLWQHLFWFFGHPEVYITILPAMGIISHIVSCFSRKPVFGYRVMIYSLMAIGFLSFMVWGHHMFISGMNPYTGFTFAVLTMAIAVPSAVKTFNWLGTMWGGKLRFATPMLFAIGFVSVFATGGLSGLFLAQPPLDVYLHATYFVVAHLHMIMGVAVTFAIFAGTYFWFPKMFGRMMNEPLGKIHFWLTLIGTYAVFMPMHFLGLEGNPRRYAAFTDNFLKRLIPMHQFITIAALITGAGQLLFFFNFFWSMFKGEKVSDNPWEGTSLEWAVPSPPPPGNFPGRRPVIYHGPYEYAVPGAEKDFVMQNSPEKIPAS